MDVLAGVFLIFVEKMIWSHNYWRWITWFEARWRTWQNAIIDAIRKPCESSSFWMQMALSIQSVACLFEGCFLITSVCLLWWELINLWIFYDSTISTYWMHWNFARDFSGYGHDRIFGEFILTWMYQIWFELTLWAKIRFYDWLNFRHGFCIATWWERHLFSNLKLGKKTPWTKAFQ